MIKPRSRATASCCSSKEPLRFPGKDRMAGRGDVLLSSCAETEDLYQTLLHEAGHALGIAGGRTGTGQARYHPNKQIIDIAMSYGAGNLLLACAPHPPDVMAPYAICQTVDST